MAQVEIILGSRTDQPALDDSKLTAVLSHCGISWRVSVLSAHRHHRQLAEHCWQATADAGAKVFIGIAGMAAALPGVIASFTDENSLRPVIGVALPSDGMPDAMDALLSLTRLPPGTPVLTTGIGKAGLYNAGLAAAQIVSTGVPEFLAKLRAYLKAQTEKKPAEIGILTSDQP